MSDSNRRAFLKQAAAGGAIAVSQTGCGGPEDDTTTPTAVPEEPLPNMDHLKMSIAKWDGKADPAGDVSAIATRVTTEAIAAMGGMRRFVEKGATVWVKPNIAIHAVEQFAANSNPAVVATLCRLCYEAGAGKVLVGDTSAYGADKAYQMSGIEAAVNAVDAEMVYLKDADYRDCDLGGEFLTAWKMSNAMLDADLLINVPIVKHHALTGVTIAMKNLMGVAWGTKETWHKDIDTCLADVTAYVKPQLHVMDAVRVLKRHGPKGGDMKDVEFMGLVAASADPVAIDAAGAELIGFKPTQVQTIVTGSKRGLGEIDFRKLSPVQRIVS